MPTAPLSIAATIMNTVSPWRIVEWTILSEFLRCQAAGQDALVATYRRS
jgi:hypothetical protein